MKPLPSYAIDSPKALTDLLWYLNAEIEYWYSYVHFGLKGKIQKHSRKDQRTYQRKFCSWLARRNTTKALYPEFYI